MTDLLWLIAVITTGTALAVWLDARWSPPSDYVGLGEAGRERGRGEC